MATNGMNERSPVRPDSHPDISLTPSPTPGFSEHNAESGANNREPGFTPQAGEGQSGARSRVIDQVLATVRANGGEPASNG